MNHSKSFFILDQGNNSEFILRACLSFEEIFNEINYIFMSIYFRNHGLFSKIIITKFENDLYELEIQIIMEKKEKSKVLSLIRKANYVNIN